MEVLLALLVAVILITVACSALITSLQAEERAGILREGRFLLQTEVARTWTGMKPRPPAAPDRWSVSHGERKEGWTLLDLASRVLPGIDLRLALHEPPSEK